MREDPLREKSKSRASLNASRVGFSSTELLPAEIKQEAVNLSSLEEKIENLMDLRLKQCIEHKKERNWALEAEVDKLVDSIHSLKEESDPEKVEEDIHLLDRKIKLFEKLIAENMTESDVPLPHSDHEKILPGEGKLQTQAPEGLHSAAGLGTFHKKRSGHNSSSRG
jgi:hypothetical protein